MRYSWHWLHHVFVLVNVVFMVLLTSCICVSECGIHGIGYIMYLCQWTWYSLYWLHHVFVPVDVVFMILVTSCMCASGCGIHDIGYIMYLC